MALINTTIIREFRPLSESFKTDDSYITSFIDEAEELDLKKLLGEQLYIDFNRNVTDAKYQTLLDGGNYMRSGNTFEYTFSGIKEILSYYAYGRFLFFGSDLNTKNGVVKKSVERAVQLTRERKKELFKYNQRIALKKFQSTRDFLNNSKTVYPFWNECKTINKNTGGTLRFINK